MTQVGRLPVRGEVISGPGNFEIEVLDADPRRVKRLRIGIAQGAPGGARARASEAAARPRPIPARRRPMTIRRRPPAMEPARSDPNQQTPHARVFRSSWPGAGSARSSRWPRARLSALAMAPFNAWPVLFLTFPVVVWLIDGAAAGKLARRAGGGDVRLLVRARLFRAGALLDRQRLPGRCADLCLADAVRGARPAGLPRPVSRRSASRWRA